MSNYPRRSTGRDRNHRRLGWGRGGGEVGRLRMGRGGLGRGIYIYLWRSSLFLKTRFVQYVEETKLETENQEVCFITPCRLILY